MVAELAVRHAGRQQGEEFAFTFGKADVAPRPSQCFIDLGVLRPLGQNDTLACAAALMPSMICCRGTAFEMNPCAPARMARRTA